MKKDLVNSFGVAAVVAAVFFLAVTGSYAAPVGGPIEEDAGETFELSLDRLSVSGGATEIVGRDLAASLGDKPELKESKQNYVQLGYNMYENIILYTKFGIADLELSSTTAGTNIKFTEEFDFGLLLGAGLKGTYKGPWGLKITGDLQYQRWKSDLERFTQDDIGTFSKGAKGDIGVQEFHVAGTVARPFYFSYLGSPCSFTPYAGMKYSQFQAREDDLDTDDLVLEDWDWRADKHFGLITGLMLGVGENWSLDVEGRFLDEYAATVGLTYNWGLGRILARKGYGSAPKRKNSWFDLSRAGQPEESQEGGVRTVSRRGGLVYKDLPRDANEYYEAVRGKLKEYVFYPADAPTGDVYVSFSVLPDGSVDDIKTLNVLKIPALEEVAVQSVKNASPFPSFPKDLKEKEVRFHIPISFAKDI